MLFEYLLSEVIQQIAKNMSLLDNILSISVVMVHFFFFFKNVGTVRQLLYDFPWTNVGKLVFVVSITVLYWYDLKVKCIILCH